MFSIPSSTYWLSQCRVFCVFTTPWRKNSFACSTSLLNDFISTPEKLYYLLKQSPELSDKIGLLIYDEGHQFDSGTRGVIYELLVTSLKKVINIDIQVVLISAVISNATNINDWLNSGNGTVVSGNFISTNRTIAFASWKTSLGQLKFINKNDIDNFDDEI